MLSCFPNALEAAKWSIEEAAHEMMDTSDTSFDYLWASKRAMAEGCSRRAVKEVSPIPYQRHPRSWHQDNADEPYRVLLNICLPLQSHGT